MTSITKYDILYTKITTSGGKEYMETKEYKIKLKDWQVPLAEHQTKVLKDQRIMLSACSTGVGKTYLACQTIRDLGMKTLVVCPKIAVSQWRGVVDGMGISDLVIGITNPEHLVASKKDPYYSVNDGWKLPDGMLLVFDEVHRGASGIDSKTTYALARWCCRSRPLSKALAMSATPFETPLKLRALGYLMGFHRFTEASFYDWCRANGCGFADIGWGKSRRRVFQFTRNKDKATAVMKNIRAEMGDRFMSITPEEVPGFPEETKEIVPVDLAKKDHDALIRAYEDMPERMTSMSEDDMVKTLRLRQQAEFCKAEVIANMAADLVEDGYSVFICLNFTDARKRVEDVLKHRKVPFASIYGGQKESERQAGVKAFQSNQTHVMVGMAAACSVALSLHDEQHERRRVSLISPGYSVSEFVQSLGRIRRVGGTHAVQKIIIAANSVEERVGRAIERKMNNLAALNDRDLMR